MGGRFYAHGVCTGVVGEKEVKKDGYTYTSYEGLKFQVKDSTEHFWSGGEQVVILSEKFVEHLQKALKVAHPADLEETEIEIIFKKKNNVY